MKKGSLQKIDYLQIYNKAHVNAFNLVKEAQILFDNKCYARAYALAYTALEEISKSQLAADVFTGFSEEQEFLENYTNHKDKLRRVKWTHIDANSFPYNQIWIGPDQEDIERINPKEPLWLKRQKGLYVDIENGNITTPAQSITEEDAQDLIHIVNIALHRIWEVTEYWGHQIGTKGFMK